MGEINNKKLEGRKREERIYTILQWMIIGGIILTLLYLLFSSYLFNSNNATVVSDFETKTEEEVVEIHDKKREENEEIDLHNFYTEDPFSHLDEEDDSDNIGVLHIPQIDEELAVYDKTNSVVLSDGVGMLSGTHYPLGEETETSVLTGHRGTHRASIFRNLDKLEIGDKFYFDNGEEELWYEVKSSEVVLPNETDKVSIEEGKTQMVLLTCDTPDPTKGVNTHRLLVYAELTDAPDEEIEVVADPLQVDKYLTYGLLLVVVLAVVKIIKETRAKLKKGNKGITGGSIGGSDDSE